MAKSTILFVCTGNIFRSLVAEYALRAHLGSGAAYLVESAGTEALPQPVSPVVRDRLLGKGVDCRGHVQRRLTREILDRADLVVAMGLDHRAFIRRVFQREAPLFNEVCHGRMEPVPDVHEALPDWRNNLEAALTYTVGVVDCIWAAMPCFMARLSDSAKQTESHD